MRRCPPLLHPTNHVSVVILRRFPLPRHTTTTPTHPIMFLLLIMATSDNAFRIWPEDDQEPLAETFIRREGRNRKTWGYDVTGNLEVKQNENNNNSNNKPRWWRWQWKEVVMVVMLMVELVMVVEIIWWDERYYIPVGAYMCVCVCVRESIVSLWRGERVECVCRICVSCAAVSGVRGVVCPTRVWRIKLEKNSGQDSVFNMQYLSLYSRERAHTHTHMGAMFLYILVHRLHISQTASVEPKQAISVTWSILRK